MRLSVMVAGFVVLASVAASAAWGDAMGELIADGSFEQSNDPLVWIENNWAKNDVTFARDPENPHSGKLSQRITMKRILGEPDVHITTQTLKVHPGETLLLGFSSRGLAGAKRFDVRLRKAGAPYTTYFMARVQPSENWQNNRYYVTLPPNTDPSDTRLMFNLREETSLWLDDVSLTPLPAKESSTPSPGNRVPNPSFEVGRDRWSATFREYGKADIVEEADAANATAAIRSIEVADAPTGRRVLEYTVHPNCSARVTSSYFPMRYGYPVTVSFYARCLDKPQGVTVTLGSGKFPDNVRQTQGFKLSEQWKQYSFTVTAKPSESQSYFLEFYSTSPATYQLDGVSAAEEDKPTAPFVVQPAIAAEPVDGSHPGNIFSKGEMASFRLRADGFAASKELPLHGRLVNAWDQLMEERELSLSIDGDGRTEKPITLPTTAFGTFKLELRHDAASRLPDAELVYSVVPDLPPLKDVTDSFFGSHVKLTPYNLAIAERAGFRWLRLHPPLATKWAVVEATHGKMVFHTDMVAAAHARGFKLLGMFDSTPPAYGDAPTPEDAAKSSWHQSYLPADLDQWKRYVKATAQAFGPYLDAWEVWNEPDYTRVKPGVDKAAAYTSLVQATREALDEMKYPANVPLVAGAVSRPYGPLLQGMIQKDMSAQVDAISFHYYYEELSPDWQRQPFSDLLTTLRSRPSRKGTPPELWHSEGGIWVDGGSSWLATANVPPSGALTPIQAIASICRTAICLKAMGVKHHLQYHALAEESGSIVYRDGCGGMIDVSGVAIGGVPAHATMVLLLEKAEPVGLNTSFVDGVQVTLATFRDEKRNIQVVWARKPVDAARVTEILSGAQRMDMMGNPAAKTLPITAEPAYFLQDRRP